MTTTALDLFAGTGWGVACQRLGIEEHGVEIMPEAVATRTAAGMSTIFRDVWDGLEGRADVPMHDVLIASPPCQTFSMAGGGAGRRALDEVVGLIRSSAYQHPLKLRAFGESHDPRTALVLTPLAYAFRHLPRVIVWEQVPTVLPVWEACAEVLRSWGYSVVVGVLSAEQHGVPQTRKRAILVARWDAEAKMPTPTHSAYYPRDPQRLDPDVLPWISMAEALGWGMTERPFITVGGSVGRAEGVGGSGGKAAIVRETDAGRWALRPATTVAGDPRIPAPGHHERQMNGATRVTIDEAATLQSYPAGFPWQGTKGKQFLQVGNAVPPLLAEAVLRAALA
jgi:DNA (cytosine-5)-methyltransferase 1